MVWDTLISNGIGALNIGFGMKLFSGYERSWLGLQFSEVKMRLTRFFGANMRVTCFKCMKIQNMS